jgi:SAM-dependent methyltransferase
MARHDIPHDAGAPHMSFSSDWLALREPADGRARDSGLCRALAAHLAAIQRTGGAGLAVDLGCGTGATQRALAPLARDLRWRLVDHDPALLAEAAARTGAETLCADLAADPAAAVAGASLVTASALFDLASADWIDRLVAALPRDAAVLAALSYDGTETWEPAHEAEATGLAAFHAHQAGDKGFGASLGPRGAAYLAQALAAAGWSVRTARSDWVLTAPRDAALITALADGSTEAAAELGVMAPDLLAGWTQARRTATRVTVGHVDVLALPPEDRGLSPKTRSR